MQVVGLHKLMMNEANSMHKVTRHPLAAAQGPFCREPDVAAVVAVQRLITIGRTPMRIAAARHDCRSVSPGPNSVGQRGAW
jgi:hypothetical protein